MPYFPGIESPVALGPTASPGTSTSFAASDHVHVDPVIAHTASPTANPHVQYWKSAGGINGTSAKTIYVQTTDPTLDGPVLDGSIWIRI